MLSSDDQMNADVDEEEESQSVERSCVPEQSSGNKKTLKSVSDLSAV